MSIETFNILLECLLPYTHPTVYPKCIGSGNQTTVKPNELSSNINVSRHGFHNGVIAYILQLGESIIHRIFVVWVVFMKAISDDAFCLPYSMTEVFNKTGHGLAYIIIA